MEKLRIGMLGFGNMGRTHLYSVENLKYYYKNLPFTASVDAVCTATAEGMERASSFGIPRTTTDEDEIIYSPDIDIIDICTPNIYHYETLKKVIAAGKHIYCEKPLCTTCSQAAEIAELAEKKHLIGQVVFNNRRLAPIMRAKQLIVEGRLGRLLSFSCSYLHSSCTDTNKNAGWKQDRDICGGGVLFDLGSHCIDLIYYLCGEFESVQGMSQIAYPTRRGRDGREWQTNADEAFYMTAKLKNGACGTITASKITVGTNDDLSFEIYGEKGALKFSLMQPNFLYFADAVGSFAPSHTSDMGGCSGFTAIECVARYPEPAYAICGVKAPVGWIRGHVGSYHDFLDSVYYGKPAVPSFRDAAHVQKVMEKAYEYASAHEGIKL